MKTDLQKLGSAIEQYIRDELHSSQMGVALRSGGLISQPLLSLICRGLRDPAELPLRNLQGLLLGLGLTREEFIARFGHDIPPVDLERVAKVNQKRKRAGEALERYIRHELLGDRPGKYKDLKEWADKAGVSRSWLYGVFRGRFDPTDLNSLQFAQFLRALKLTPEQFTELTGLEIPGLESPMAHFPVYSPLAAAPHSRYRALGGAGVCFPASEIPDARRIRVYHLLEHFFVSEAVLRHPKSVAEGDYVLVTDEPGPMEAWWWPAEQALVIGMVDEPLGVGWGPSRLQIKLPDRRSLEEVGSVVARLGSTQE